MLLWGYMGEGGRECVGLLWLGECLEDLHMLCERVGEGCCVVGVAAMLDSAMLVR